MHRLLSEATAEANQSSYRKLSPPQFLLFTTQRSGSMWVCEVLHAQAGIICGSQEAAPGLAESGAHWQDSRGEPMLSAVNANASLSWDDWKRDAEQAFRVISHEAVHRRHTDALGWKLMYVMCTSTY